MFEFVNKILTSQEGATQLFSVGQAGFIIKSSSGMLLGIDLYLSDCVERLEGNKGYKRLLPRILDASELVFDVIIATHPHKDHFDDDSILELMNNDKTNLFASVNCQQNVKEIGLKSNRITYVKPEDTYTIGDFQIECVKCDHGESAPDAVGVVITVDGKKILEVGDTCLRKDWIDMYKEYGHFDVMIAPINGMYGNLNAEECAFLANEIDPKLLIPCHYGMFASHMGSPGEFYNIMNEKYPDNKFMLMMLGEGIVIE